jgi:transposase-like protein
MDPSQLFCPNPDCPKHGLSGYGNLGVHSQKERRLRCYLCGKTFAASRGTPFYRLRTEETVVTLVVTLLAWGCPLQAIVHAFGFDERTVQQWAERAGEHCQRVHEDLVEAGRIEAGQVQADELWVKLVARKVWMAMAVAVPSRLWLGGVISAHRDGELIRELALGVRRCLSSLGILLCVDGLGSYVTQFRRIFRVPEPREPGKRGKPRSLPAPGFLLGQVIKCYEKKRVAAVSQRAVCGTMAEILERVRATGGTMIHTAYIERLNATFRSRLSGLVRRTRSLLRRERMLQAGMYLVGGVYNFCTPHRSLGQSLPVWELATGERKWRERTPAMAAELTDHVWSVSELLHYRVVPKRADRSRWKGKRRRGAISKQPRAPLAARTETTI